MSEMMIGIQIVFANYERRLISQRTREGLQARKLRGEKYCRWAEYGWRWEKRFDAGLKKDVNVKVPDEQERMIMRKVVELRAAGQSLDAVRQHLVYSLKVRTRMGGEWTNGRIASLFKQGLCFMAGKAEPIQSEANGEEEYDGLIELEDENND